ncbi:uncharacterized protein LOC126783189 [Argentina anserina]|uniref:uncharacterized protein LOC126783189 n=1 Tax=Argentina anserina TaxID=57926 RepID=UPI0021764C2F|nr:uncharacterized protein LOC126783189 [Potentilla anserina]
MKESSSSMTPLLFRNLITSLFILAETSISSLAQKHKALELIRYVFVSCFLFFLRLLLSLNPRSTKNSESLFSTVYDYNEKPPNKVTGRKNKYMPAANGRAGGDSDNEKDTAIARALSQLLSIVNDIPVSSRKYQVVRSLAENLIHENQKEGVEALRQVNRRALTAAFSRTLNQLEAAAILEQQQHHSGGDIDGLVCGHHHWAVRAVRLVADVVWSKEVTSSGGSRSSEEKLAAELLWLAETMASCGFAQEAVWRWASASGLARLSITAEPRLQASLVKLSALLLKYAKDMGVDKGDDHEHDYKGSNEKRETKQVKMQMQMLVLWIPLLCIASNGTDVPVLSINERAELERVLEEIIEKQLAEEDQERVLTLWLHHFTCCSSSDWPNLHASYARWCKASRKQLLI